MPASSPVEASFLCSLARACLEFRTRIQRQRDAASKLQIVAQPWGSGPHPWPQIKASVHASIVAGIASQAHASACLEPWEHSSSGPVSRVPPVSLALLHSASVRLPPAVPVLPLPEVTQRWTVWEVFGADAKAGSEPSAEGTPFTVTITTGPEIAICRQFALRVRNSIFLQSDVSLSLP